MHRSSALARIVTTLVTLLAVPIALLALSAGGMPWMQAVIRRIPLEASLSQVLPMSIGWLLLGVVLLLVVGLLGIWSSAGLLVAGIYAALFLLAVLVPALTVELTRPLSEVLPGQLGLVGSSGLYYGVPALVTIVLPVMGAVLARARRRPGTSRGLSVVGTILSPVLLLAGTLLLVGGIAAGLAVQLQRLQLAPQPVPGAAVLIGAALIVLGVALTGVAPYALILPALAAIGLTGLFLTALPYEVAGGGAVGGLRTMNVVSTLHGALLTGAGLGLAALFLGFTVAVAVVRRRAGNRPREAAAA
jgi:hypothetical protein